MPVAPRGDQHSPPSPGVDTDRPSSKRRVTSRSACCATEAGSGAAHRVGYQRVLARQPSKAESAAHERGGEQTALYNQNDTAARALLAVGESKADTQLPVAELAA